MAPKFGHLWAWGDLFGLALRESGGVCGIEPDLQFDGLIRIPAFDDLAMIV